MRDELRDGNRSSVLSRRDLLRRAAILGVSLPIAGSLITACEIEDDDDVVDDVEDDDVDPVVDPDDDVDDDIDDEPVDDADDDVVDDDPDDEEEQYGGRLILLGHHPVETLHPDDAGPAVTWTIINAMHESLVQVDESYEEIEPLLATDWEVDDDGMQYTFTLRDDVTFHDGKQMTAEDVKYTFDWYMDPDNAAVTAALFEEVDNVEAPDDYTIVLNMEAADATILSQAMDSGMIVHMDHHEELGYEAYSADPIGTGPFQLLEWDPDDFTLVGAFEDHWAGRPYLDEIEVRIIPEGSVRRLEVETGGAHSPIWPLATDDWQALDEMDEITTLMLQTPSLNHFAMDNTLPQFEDREVRQAFMYAIDRDRVIDSVFAGGAIKATANIVPTLEEWWNPDLYEYEYDPDRAIELLEEAGWVDDDGDGIREKDGELLEWTCYVITGDEVRRPQAEMVQEFLSAVGANMQISETPSTSTLMREGDGDMALFNWGYGGFEGEPDARSTLHTDGGNNFNHYSNPEMDELLVEGVRTVDPDERQEIYFRIQEIVVEDVPMLFFSHWHWPQQFRTEVQGLPPDEQVLGPHRVYRNVLLRQYWLEEQE